MYSLTVSNCKLRNKVSVADLPFCPHEYASRQSLERANPLKFHCRFQDRRHVTRIPSLLSGYKQSKIDNLLLLNAAIHAGI